MHMCRDALLYSSDCFSKCFGMGHTQSRKKIFRLFFAMPMQRRYMFMLLWPLSFRQIEKIFRTPKELSGDAPAARSEFKSIELHGEISGQNFCTLSFIMHGSSLRIDIVCFPHLCGNCWMLPS